MCCSSTASRRREDSENLPAPEVIAAEIVEDLQAALDQFAAIAASLGGSGTDLQVE
jgi:type I restriction enzyme M protein